MNKENVFNKLMVVGMEAEGGTIHETFNIMRF